MASRVVRNEYHLAAMAMAVAVVMVFVACVLLCIPTGVLFELSLAGR